MVGDGVSIDQVSEALLAPCDGQILQLHSAPAVTVGTSDGLEIMMHIGLDTVQLKGQGFCATCRLHQRPLRCKRNRHGRATSPTPVAGRDEPPALANPEIAQKAQELRAALGADGNIETLELCALTRLRVTVKDPTMLRDEHLRAAGAQAIMRLPNRTLHIVLGSRAPEFASAFKRIEAGL